jgi:hypothetical protein
VATENLADGMQVKLELLYGTEFVADGYIQWARDHGIEWESLLAFTESETGIAGWDGWNAYWTSDEEEEGETFRILLENGDFLMTEDDNYLRTE